MSAPEAFTALATATICSSDSTEQGPAIMQKWPPPILTFPTCTTVSSGWNFRLQHLKGSVTRFTESTMPRLPMRSMSTLVVSPTRPSTVWYSPWEMCTCSPCSDSQSMSWACFSCSTPLFSTTIIFCSLRLSVKMKNAAQV